MPGASIPWGNEAGIFITDILGGKQKFFYMKNWLSFLAFPGGKKKSLVHETLVPFSNLPMRGERIVPPSQRGKNVLEHEISAQFLSLPRVVEEVFSIHV